MSPFTLLGVLGLAVGLGATQKPVRQATLHDAAGKDVGRVTLHEKSGQVTVTMHLRHLPAGIHGVHLHQNPKCDPPDFQTAGGHYNPTSRKHGRKNPDGPHIGDLGNITIGKNGNGDREVTITSTMTRQGMTAFIGTGLAVVVHASADDEMTDPSGNSGARIACAVIAP